LNATRSKLLLPLLVAYVVTMVAIFIGLLALRRHALPTLSTRAAAVDWQDWRESAEKLEGSEGPVQRRAPQVIEPPALILMRDHFGVCVATVVASGSLLFAVTTFAVRSMLSTNVSPIRDE